MSQPDSDDQIAAVRGLQPLLHPQARRARPAAAEKPVLAERGAGAVRTGAPRRCRRQGDRDRARPRSRLSQPDRPEIRRGRADHPQAAGRGPAAIPARPDRQGAPGVRQARSQFAGRRRRHARSAARTATAGAWSRRWPRSSGCSAHRAPRRRRRSCASPVRATWAGWCRAMARSMPANTVLTPRSKRWSRRSPRNSSPRSTPRASAAGSPSSTAPRSARYFWSGTATTSPNCACCWSIRPGADRAWAAAGRRMHLVRAGLRLSQDHAVDPEHPGRRAQNLSGCRIRAGRHRAAPQFRPKPDRRDLGARAVTPARRDATAPRHAGTDGLS